MKTLPVIIAAIGLLLLPERSHGQFVEAWAQRFSNAANSRTEGVKVVVDSGGDVIVAGFSDGSSTGPDILVIKYDGTGQPLWTNL